MCSTFAKYLTSKCRTSFTYALGYLFNTKNSANNRSRNRGPYHFITHRFGCHSMNFQLCQFDLQSRIVCHHIDRSFVSEIRNPRSADCDNPSSKQQTLPSFARSSTCQCDTANATLCLLFLDAAESKALSRPKSTASLLRIIAFGQHIKDIVA